VAVYIGGVVGIVGWDAERWGACIACMRVVLGCGTGKCRFEGCVDVCGVGGWWW
jgi:hypothetical protein